MSIIMNNNGGGGKMIIRSAGGGGGAADGGASVGTYSTRPVATAGSTFYPTDGWCSYVADGSTWRPIIGGIAGTQPDPASSFTPINMSATSALVDNAGVLIASDLTTTSTNPDYRVWVQSLTGGSTGVEASMMMAPTITGWDGSNASFNFGGLALRESSTGKIAAFMMFQTPSSYMQIDFRCEYVSAATGGSRAVVANEVNKLYSVISPNLFLRMRVSSGTLYFEYSTGRGDWFGVASISSSTVFTSGNPDQFGLVLWPYNISSAPASARIIVPHMTQI